MEKKITKNMTISEVIATCPKALEVFLESGMSCMGCPMSMSETLEQGAKAHGIKVEELIAKINKAQGKETKNVKI